MPIYINGKKVSAIKRNGVDYVKVYHGEDLVWQKGYYKTHKWLKGDGMAYINTEITYSQMVISIVYKNCSHTDKSEFLFGCRASGRGICVFPEGTMNGLRPTNVQYYRENIAFQKKIDEGAFISGSYVCFTFSLGRHELSFNNETLIYDDNVVTGTPLYLYDKPIYLFYNNDSLMDWGKFSGAIGSFNIGNRLSLLPCQLLRTLPASKAWDGETHAAGECGMWDTVSDKFYGNANTSGTFSVSDED